MCNQCVRALSVISEGMNQYLMEAFEVAVRRDLSQDMNDEEGMFHLLAFELALEELKNVVDLEVHLQLNLNPSLLLWRSRKYMMPSIQEQNI